MTPYKILIKVSSINKLPTIMTLAFQSSSFITFSREMMLWKQLWLLQKQSSTISIKGYHFTLLWRIFKNWIRGEKKAYLHTLLHLQEVTWRTCFSNLSNGKIRGISNIYIAFIIHGHPFWMIKTSIIRLSISMPSVTLKRSSNKSCPTICSIILLRGRNM